MSHAVSYRVMILEDDPSMAELLGHVVRQLWAGSRVSTFSDVPSALKHWNEHKADLVLVDWTLPGENGTAFLDVVHREAPLTRRVMISGNVDKQVVIEARKVGVDGFIAKPFQIQDVMQRLAAIMAVPKSSLTGDALREPLPDFLRREIQRGQFGLPVTGKLRLNADGSQHDPVETLQLWRQHPAPLARLIGAANTGAYNLDGRAIESFTEAVKLLGFQTANTLIQGLAMQPGSDIQHPLLQDLVKEFLNDSLRIAAIATRLARAAGAPPDPCINAAMLFRMGELACLQLIQRWVTAGGEPEEAECRHELAKHAPEVGNLLKMQWRLPLNLRVRVGAMYSLQPGTVKVDRIIMRIAGLVLSQGERKEIRRLLGRIGFDGDQINAFMDEWYPPAMRA